MSNIRNQENRFATNATQGVNLRQSSGAESSKGKYSKLGRFIGHMAMFLDSLEELEQ